MTVLFDAHLHATRLESPLPPSIAGAVSNGTAPGDWDVVLALAREDSRIRPAIGLHPWFVDDTSDGWEADLRRLLVAYPRTSVGEVGLDRAARGIALFTDQIVALRTQLTIAAELDRAVSIHCVRAYDALLTTLRDGPLPARGVVLHGYGGPADLVPTLAGLGACFSFAPGFEAVEDRVAAFASVPAGRLVVETDSPGRGRDPDDLAGAYASLAAIRGVSVDSLAAEVAVTVAALFD